MEAFKSKKLPLHVLINNAGLQAPYDDNTDEGFEVPDVAGLHRHASCLYLCTCIALGKSTRPQLCRYGV